MLDSPSLNFAMKRPVRADLEKFHRELETYRSTIADLSKNRQETSFLDKQILFWMESARFLINELEVWGNLPDETRYDVTRNKLQKNLDYLNALISQLAEERGGELAEDE